MDEEVDLQETQKRFDAGILANRFLKSGIFDTTKEMTADALRISMEELDRRFTGKRDCMMWAARWFQVTVWQPLNRRYDEFFGMEYTGAALLEMYMIDLKKVFFREPRMFVFYAECKTFFYRYSLDYQKHYTQLLETIGCRERIEQMILLGGQDGSIQPGADAQEEADYFYRAYFGFLFNMALACGDQPKLATEQIDRYISRVVGVFRKECALPQVPARKC